MYKKKLRYSKQKNEETNMANYFLNCNKRKNSIAQEFCF